MPGDTQETAAAAEITRLLSAPMPGTCCGLPQVPFVSLRVIACVPRLVADAPADHAVARGGQDTESAEPDPGTEPTVPMIVRACCQVPFFSSATKPAKVLRLSAT